LRIALIENGAGWVPGLLHRLDHTWSQMPQAFAEKPSDTFKKNFWMHPFHEEDPRDLIKLLGADHVIFGSDYPHIEGLADPVSWADEVSGLDDATLRKVMGGNMMDLLGISAPVPA
jgi:predicted TIM-barrel fold metal-dependent hydrolase